MQTTTIDLLRHGECEGGQVYRGRLDFPLNAVGWQQLRDKTQNVGVWTQIVSSPLQRCALFAQEVAERCDKPVSIMDGFREVDFGDWEGRLIADVWREQGSDARRFFADPVNAAPPNGEPMLMFEQRVLAAWQQLLQTLRGEHVLLVAHGGTIRVLLAHVLAMPLQRIASLDVPYASASRIRVHHSTDHPDFSTLVFHNSRF
ncbi:MAG: alpha-ribazole phosphatase family protein [Pseudomonadales bacterium]